MKGADHDTIAGSILKTLIYFDLFQYPLTAKEIYTHFQVREISMSTLKANLDDLVEAGKIYSFGDCYSVRNAPELELRRRKGNVLAIQYMKKAQRQARVIARFPFVEGVLVSGSLSKGYVDQSSDIDFFIITSPGRLWIARTLLVLYKRIWLFNSHKYFCVNYFIDRDHLEIRERNIYTATELATLIPLRGYPAYRELMHNNVWMKTFCPNFVQRAIATDAPESISVVIRTIVERILERLWPNALDRFLMKLTFRRWKRLYRDFEKADFQLAFKTNRHISKSHKNNFQKKTLASYEERIQEVDELINTPITV